MCATPGRGEIMVGVCGRRRERRRDGDRAEQGRLERMRRVVCHAADGAGTVMARFEVRVCECRALGREKGGEQACDEQGRDEPTPAGTRSDGGPARCAALLS